MEQVNLKGTFLRLQILYLSSIVHDVHHEATCRSTTKSHAQIRLCEKQSKYFVSKWRCFKTPLYKNMHMSANIIACAIFWFILWENESTERSLLQYVLYPANQVIPSFSENKYLFSVSAILDLMIKSTLGYEEGAVYLFLVERRFDYDFYTHFSEEKLKRVNVVWQRVLFTTQSNQFNLLMAIACRPITLESHSRHHKMRNFVYFP